MRAGGKKAAGAEVICTQKICTEECIINKSTG